MGRLKRSIKGMTFVPLLLSREVEHLVVWAQVHDPVWLLASSRWKLNLTPSHVQLPELETLPPLNCFSQVPIWLLERLSLGSMLSVLHSTIKGAFIKHHHFYEPPSLSKIKKHSVTHEGKIVRIRICIAVMLIKQGEMQII